MPPPVIEHQTRLVVAAETTRHRTILWSGDSGRERPHDSPRAVRTQKYPRAQNASLRERSPPPPDAQTCTHGGVRQAGIGTDSFREDITDPVLDGGGATPSRDNLLGPASPLRPRARDYLRAYTAHGHHGHVESDEPGTTKTQAPASRGRDKTPTHVSGKAQH